MNTLVLGSIIAAIVVVIVVIVLVYRHMTIEKRITFTFNPYDLPSSGYCIPVPAVFGASSDVSTITFTYTSKGLYTGDFSTQTGNSKYPVAIVVVDYNGKKLGFIANIVDSEPNIPTASSGQITSGTCNVYFGPGYRGCGVLYLSDLLTPEEYDAISVYPSAIPDSFTLNGCT